MKAVRSSDNANPEVTVLCLTYNHEKSISQCLDSILEQETSFPFQVLIHDDASTDHTAEIIRAYAQKHPDIIVPVLEEENQYQRGVFVIDEVMLPLAEGRYFAYLEGDDLWCDEKKLQRQYDYMEHVPECAMCGHNTIVKDMRGTQPNQLFFPWRTLHRMNAEEVFLGWNIHSSSYFVRSEFAATPLITHATWLFDYAQLATRFAHGSIDLLPETMSVYHFANPEGISANHGKFFSDGKLVEEERSTFLKEYKAAYPGFCEEVIDRRIRETDSRKELSLLAAELLALLNDKSLNREACAKAVLALSESPRWRVFEDCLSRTEDVNYSMARRIADLLNSI